MSYLWTSSGQITALWLLSPTLLSCNSHTTITFLCDGLKPIAPFPFQIRINDISSHSKATYNTSLGFDDAVLEPRLSTFFHFSSDQRELNDFIAPPPPVREKGDLKTFLFFSVSKNAVDHLMANATELFVYC
ncbi:hypothetical protein BCR42DRAFT_475739 [Absidia repens]|uniref:Uncharacterized protein n=1 Tax=Absidia repens TaxID=90262 RepID=A0A1X2IPJ4_9FUNG|nr:hypothetical protein BCR42DRAFT_475739 [Absidia repens]